ncbi:MAG: hypothetical protein KDD34_06760 [Bdellovibrionales bacterium]|nr:hypothetical protein [Bdellovibrionales bacterium]
MRHFLTFLVMAWVGPAWSAFDVSCIENNCMTQGWEIWDQTTGRQSFVECFDQDCLTKGWVESPGFNRSESHCLFDDCFGKGWEVFSVATGDLLYSVRCEKDPEQNKTDCLTSGWSVLSSRGRMISHTTCLAGDCEKYGWDIELSNGAIQVVRCKDESCFNSGWTLRP